MVLLTHFYISDFRQEVAYVKENNLLMSGGTDYHYPKRANIMLPDMDKKDAEEIAEWVINCFGNQMQ